MNAYGVNPTPLLACLTDVDLTEELARRMAAMIIAGNERCGLDSEYTTLTLTINGTVTGGFVVGRYAYHSTTGKAIHGETLADAIYESARLQGRQKSLAQLRITKASLIPAAAPEPEPPPLACPTAHVAPFDNIPF